MIARVKALYRHLLRRSPAPDEHPLDWKVTQIRHPMTELEYVEVFGRTHAGIPATVSVNEDGTKSITLLDEHDLVSPLENESRSTFAPVGDE